MYDDGDEIQNVGKVAQEESTRINIKILVGVHESTKFLLIRVQALGCSANSKIDGSRLTLSIHIVYRQASRELYICSILYRIPCRTT